MRLYYFLPVFILFFFATDSHAQLTNGTQALGGFGVSEWDSLKVSKPTANGSFNFGFSYFVK